MTKIDPYVGKILTKYLPDDINKNDAIWLHKQSKQWIAKHRTLEIIAAKAKITFKSPQVVESDVANKVCVLCVEGSMGEASPANCMNAYPAAMAEKRGKDRVILKLLGLHGYVYSDIEIEEEKEKPEVKKVAPVVKKSTSPADWFNEATKGMASLDTYMPWYESEFKPKLGAKTLEVQKIMKDLHEVKLKELNK